jgi:hypothetical protein
VPLIIGSDMSNQPPNPPSINIEFYDDQGNFIQGVPILTSTPIPIPDVGECVEFFGDTYQVAKRRFSYKIGNPNQFGDAKVVLTCNKVP